MILELVIVLFNLCGEYLYYMPNIYQIQAVTANFLNKYYNMEILNMK